jgi:hypothetical protein
MTYPAKPIKQEVIRDADIWNAVDKRRYNVLNQGEAKATKNIIQYSELIEPGLREISVNNGELY